MYAFNRAELTSALEALVSRSDLVFEDGKRVRRAIRHLAEGGDVADGLILNRAQAAGCTALASFDKQLKKRLPDFINTPS